MWLPWVKSPTRIHTRFPSSTSFDFDNTSQPPSPLSRNPINNHSISLKDIENLLNHNHHHPLKPPRTPTRTHKPASFKDIHTLLNPDPDPDPNLNPLRKPSIFHRVRAWAHRQAQPPPDGQNRVVIYYTSLRIVRKTFNDCRTVRSILKGYRVKTDERDLSMHVEFVNELQKITGNNNNKSDFISLPKVFINGKYISGGADEIRRMHEHGDLKRLIQGLPLAETGVCDVCGGYRFVMCQVCDGSRRVYRDGFGFKSCLKCNENGLIRCHCCTSVVF